MDATGPDVIIIIGNQADLHASAVATVLEKHGVSVRILDAATLGSSPWRWANDSFEVRLDDCWRRPSRGWFRRLAPPDWHKGVVLGSLQAAEASARTGLLTALDSSSTRWLTPYWSLARAENKLTQYAEAKRIGLAVPETAVCSRISELPQGLGDEIVVKPLGLGEFVTDGVAHAVHTHSMSIDDERLLAMDVAPFIVQRRIHAVRHLRVVTVVNEAWVSSIDAKNLPVDWRAAPAAHGAWRAVDEYAAVGNDALHLARELGLGYSSQDWMLDSNGDPWFIDLNPAGQWMFLPPDVSEPVTKRLAMWLIGQ